MWIAVTLISAFPDIYLSILSCSWLQMSPLHIPLLWPDYSSWLSLPFIFFIFILDIYILNPYPLSILQELLVFILYKYIVFITVFKPTKYRTVMVMFLKPCMLITCMLITVGQKLQNTLFLFSLSLVNQPKPKYDLFLSSFSSFYNSTSAIPTIRLVTSNTDL